MQSRCRACNSEFLPRINKHTHQEEDLCSECITISYLSNLDSDIDLKEDPDQLLDCFDLSSGVDIEDDDDAIID